MLFGFRLSVISTDKKLKLFIYNKVVYIWQTYWLFILKDDIICLMTLLFN